MKEFLGSIWVHYGIAKHYVCITTNGTTRKDGQAVMGRGNAKQAKIVIPEVAIFLGRYLRKNGNRAGFLEDSEYMQAWNRVIVFPVKQQWWQEADIGLIRASEFWLRKEAKENPDYVYHLPRPGCGNGQKDWESEVKPIVSNLPENVWVHHLEIEP